MTQEPAGPGGGGCCCRQGGPICHPPPPSIHRRCTQVTRDRLMLALDKQYPQYGFAQHKGCAASPLRAGALALRRPPLAGGCSARRRALPPPPSVRRSYPVPAHVAAIREHGPCPQHRRSFKPIKGGDFQGRTADGGGGSGGA